MNENNYVYRDINGDHGSQDQTLNHQENDQKSILLRRTIGTGLITALITFILTVAVLAYAFYLLYMPMLKNQSANILSFDSTSETATAVEKLKTIISRLHDNYLEELTDAQILEAIAAGLPASLDNPYTYYMSAKDYEANQEAMSGKYVGIGCIVTQTENVGVEIVEILPDSPAQKAGVLIGDVIVSIDGVKVEPASEPGDIAARVKGLEGSSVLLELYRPSDKTTVSRTIVRQTIKSQNVRYKMLNATTGYVQVKTFAEGVPKDFIAAMDSLQKSGAQNVVFDLRNNSGGNAQVMIEMLEYLLPPDTLLASIKGRENGEPFEIKWITKEKMMVPETMRYAILTNAHTASASEFFSGCLRDHKKAVLIGANTFGKGSGTKLYDLPDGSAVNITMFKYYLPNGESIEGVGLKPDIEAAIADEFLSKSIETLTVEQDIPLQKAIENLK